MVMGGDSCLEGHVFDSQHRILYGHFSTYICSKNRNLFEKTKINEKVTLNFYVNCFFLICDLISWVVIKDNHNLYLKKQNKKCPFRLKQCSFIVPFDFYVIATSW